MRRVPLHENILSRWISVCDWCWCWPRNSVKSLCASPVVLGILDYITEIRYRPKGVFGKGVGNTKNASEMRQNGPCFIGKRGTFQNASEMRQISVKNASKMRGTPLGENTFWTIPTNSETPIITQKCFSGISACKGITELQKEILEELNT